MIIILISVGQWLCQGARPYSLEECRSADPSSCEALHFPPGRNVMQRDATCNSTMLFKLHKAKVVAARLWSLHLVCLTMSNIQHQTLLAACICIFHSNILNILKLSSINTLWRHATMCIKGLVVLLKTQTCHIPIQYSRPSLGQKIHLDGWTCWHGWKHV